MSLLKNNKKGIRKTAQDETDNIWSGKENRYSKEGMVSNLTLGYRKTNCAHKIWLDHTEI